MRKLIDNVLVINVFIIIFGSILFLSSVVSSMYNIDAPLRLLQLLWYPLFVPSISLFFTAVLIQALITKILNKDN